MQTTTQVLAWSILGVVVIVALIALLEALGVSVINSIRGQLGV